MPLAKPSAQSNLTDAHRELIRILAEAAAEEFFEQLPINADAHLSLEKNHDFE
jgi:hypothetical protein